MHSRFSFLVAKTAPFPYRFCMECGRFRTWPELERNVPFSATVAKNSTFRSRGFRWKDGLPNGLRGCLPCGGLVAARISHPPFRGFSLPRKEKSCPTGWEMVFHYSVRFQRLGDGSPRRQKLSHLVVKSTTFPASKENYYSRTVD